MVAVDVREAVAQEAMVVRAPREERSRGVDVTSHVPGDGEASVGVVGAAMDGAMELARAISANGPLAVRISKQIIEESRGWSLESRWDEQAKLTPIVFASEDAREGAAAFAEKRAPNWKGK